MKARRFAVYVEWLDSCGDRGWSAPDEKEDARQMKIVSIGLLVYETATVLAISTSKNVNNKFMDILAIPKKVITKRVLVTELKPKRRRK